MGDRRCASTCGTRVADRSGAKASYTIVPGVDAPARLAVDGRPPADGRFPLAVYSHGGGGFSVVATFFTEVLASHGYVVAAPDHPGDTIVESALGLNNTDYPSNVANRVDDLQRVLTALTVPGPTTPAAITGAVDPRRIVRAATRSAARPRSVSPPPTRASTRSSPWTPPRTS